MLNSREYRYGTVCRWKTKSIKKVTRKGYIANKIIESIKNKLEELENGH